MVHCDALDPKYASRAISRTLLTIRSCRQLVGRCAYGMWVCGEERSANCGSNEPDLGV